MPARRCVACREMKEKNNLFRVVKVQDHFQLDATGKKDGRGAYVCRTETCIKKAVKTRGFDRSFKRKVSTEIYEDIQKIKIIGGG